MCQYSAVDGCATDWHLVHWGQLLMSGAGLFIDRSHRGDGRRPDHARLLRTLQRCLRGRADAYARPRACAMPADRGRDATRARRPQGLVSRAMGGRRSDSGERRRLGAGRAVRDCARSARTAAGGARRRGTSARPRRVRAQRAARACARASTRWSCTWRTVTCCTSSCRRSRIAAPTTTAAGSSSESGFRSKCSTPCAPTGPRIVRSVCGCHAPTGSMAAGRSTNRSSSRGGWSRAAATGSTHRVVACRRLRKSRSPQAIR